LWYEEFRTATSRSSETAVGERSKVLKQGRKNPRAKKEKKKEKGRTSSVPPKKENFRNSRKEKKNKFLTGHWKDEKAG